LDDDDLDPGPESGQGILKARNSLETLWAIHFAAGGCFFVTALDLNREYPCFSLSK